MKDKEDGEGTTGTNEAQGKDEAVEGGTEVVNKNGESGD